MIYVFSTCRYGDSMTADRLRKAISRAAEDSFRVSGQITKTPNSEPR